MKKILAILIGVVTVVTLTACQPWPAIMRSANNLPLFGQRGVVGEETVTWEVPGEEVPEKVWVIAVGITNWTEVDVVDGIASFTFTPASSGSTLITFALDKDNPATGASYAFVNQEIPNASNTGPNESLFTRNFNHSVTLKSDGVYNMLNQKIENYEIISSKKTFRNFSLGGTIFIEASDINIDNFKVFGSQGNAITGGNNIVVSNCLLDDTGTHDFSFNAGAYSMGPNSTIEKCEIIGYEGGPYAFANNATIRDNYIHDLWEIEYPEWHPCFGNPGGVNCIHAEAIRLNQGTSGHRIYNNVALCGPGTCNTSTFFIEEHPEPNSEAGVQNVLVAGNIFGGAELGGLYTVYLGGIDDGTSDLHYWNNCVIERTDSGTEFVGDGGEDGTSLGWDIDDDCGL